MDISVTLKHNAMKCEIQNTGKTPVKNKYGKIPSNYTDILSGHIH